MNEQIAKKAAEVWANYLKQNKKNDVGDKISNFVINLQKSVSKPKFTDENIKNFERKMFEKLNKRLAEEALLTVDYEPCTLLLEICRETDVNPGCLPLKSIMILYDNNEEPKEKSRIEFKFGYSSRWETIYI